MRTFRMFLAAITLTLLFVPSGMSGTASAASIFDQVDQLRNHVEQENWEHASTFSEQIESWFEKNRWKIQFLSYESEYQEVERYISQLRSVLEEKDKTQSKVIIESLRSALRDIYRF